MHRPRVTRCTIRCAEQRCRCSGSGTTDRQWMPTPSTVRARPLPIVKRCSSSSASCCRRSSARSTRPFWRLRCRSSAATSATFRSLPWLITAYMLASTAVIPLYGKIADIHGRRFTLRIAILTYMAGSLVCALAPNMWALIFGRALHGLGGGGLSSDGHDRARRPGRAEGARPVLQLFRHHLHDGRRLRPRARRLHRRAPALVGDLLDQHPAGAGGADDHHIHAAPPAALRAAAPARHHRRAADRHRQRIVHAGAEPRRRALRLDVAAAARPVGGRRRGGRSVRAAAGDRA